MPLKKLPLSKSSFKDIRDEDCLYIDKTALIYQMTHCASDCIFLARPRRFGKTLLVNTLKEYFLGHRELFKGLAIENLETEWKQFPVLQFDMSQSKHTTKAGLEENISRQLELYENIYGRDRSATMLSERFIALIENAHRQTGEKVVVLIDEYDAPMLDVIHLPEQLDVVRNIMRNFYAPIKACNQYLRFVFLAGITKFSQVSIFSELNNMLNISMVEEFASICGITESEMLTLLPDYVNELSEKLQLTFDETVATLKEMYDGYHFTAPSPDIYNPYSLLNSLSAKAINSFWFETATPTFLIEKLRQFKVLPQNIGGTKCQAEDFDAPTERLVDITPLLYQSGYLTIKDFSPFKKQYTLDLPNKEVRIGLMRSLLTEYVTSPIPVKNLVADMAEMIYFGKLEDALQLMKQLLGTIPYCENTKYEGHFQSLMYLMFTLFGQYLAVEVRTTTGRVDMVMRTATTIYIFELKLNGTADEAMQQINDKDYASHFKFENKRIVKVGLSFDIEKRTLKDWLIAD